MPRHIPQVTCSRCAAPRHCRAHTLSRPHTVAPTHCRAHTLSRPHTVAPTHCRAHPPPRRQAACSFFVLVSILWTEKHGGPLNGDLHVAKPSKLLARSEACVGKS